MFQPFRMERRVHNMLECIRRPVYNLIHAGAIITVRELQGANSTPFRQGLRCFVRNGRNEMFFGLTREEWEELQRLRPNSPEVTLLMRLTGKEELWRRMTRATSELTPVTLTSLKWKWVLIPCVVPLSEYINSPPPPTPSSIVFSQVPLQTPINQCAMDEGLASVDLDDLRFDPFLSSQCT
jgi:hypothetical protein